MFCAFGFGVSKPISSIGPFCDAGIASKFGMSGSSPVS